MAAPTTAPQMDATELRECLEVLRWGQADLADLLQVDVSTVRRWSRDKGNPVPDPVAAWLRTIADAFAALLQANPPPPPRRGRLAA